MIVISEKHKNQIGAVLKNYKPENVVETVAKLSPILKEYHPSDPNKVGKRLLNDLFSRWWQKENETIVHYWVLCKLIFDYQYPAEQIALEVPCGGLGRKALEPQKLKDAFADIVVYSHESRRPGTALIVIEAREYRGKSGVKQAASYARALNSKYHLFTDSERWDAFETQPYPVDGKPMSDIPKWVGFKPLDKRLSKDQILPALTDEQQLRELVKVCHNEIHSEGIDPAKAFDELVKLLFVKVYDEQEIPDEYKFSILSGETPDQVGQHIRDLLRKAGRESKYKQLFAEPGDTEFSISNKAIYKVVETFQGFSFAGRSLIGIDAKGTVYENMVGSTFRGELGQYFTPRKIVEFIVDMLKPTRRDFVLDPACGSGGFLIYVLRKVADEIRVEQRNLPQHRIERIIKEFADNNLFGTDLSPRMVRAARMNMIMHGDGWTGINRCHGLEIHKDRKLKGLAGKVTLILSNPPFAGFETDENILKEFEVGKNEAGQIRGVNRALVFVEQIINLLDEGGRAGIVLPRSIFENESYSFRKLRNLIFENTEILALIGLPKTAFHHTDCGILGDLLFIKKTAAPRTDYKVFVHWAENVGYNTLGHNIEKSDFGKILELYSEHGGKNSIPVKVLRKEDNINPWHYHPKYKKIRRGIASTQRQLTPLTKLASAYNNRISRKLLKQTPQRALLYLEVRDFDPETGTFSPTEYKINTLPSRATYELSGEDLILVPNARNSLESGRRIVMVGEESRGLILTNRFLPLRPKVNPEYLVMMLNTDFVRNQFILACRGAGSPDFRENKLDDIMIPIPDSDDLSSIDAFMESISDKVALKKRLEADVLKTGQEIDKLIKNVIPNAAS